MQLFPTIPIRNPFRVLAAPSERCLRYTESRVPKGGMIYASMAESLCSVVSYN